MPVSKDAGPNVGVDSDAIATTVATPSSSGLIVGDRPRRRRLAAGLIIAELLLLTAAVVVFRRSSIEDRIAKSVSNAISIDHPGLRVEVTGRDVTIKGAVVDPKAKAVIAAIAGRRPGVRAVNVDGLGTAADLDPANTGTVPGGIPVPTTLPPPIRPPQVTADFTATAIVVSGEVPSTEAKDALLGRLRANDLLADKVTIATKVTERADIAEYRRVGTFFDTIARLGVVRANVNVDRTIVSLTAEVGSSADRDLLRRESIVLVGGDPTRVRGQIMVTGLTSDTTSADSVASPDTAVAGSTTTTQSPADSTTEATTDTAVGGTVTVPPLPSTPEAAAAQSAITKAIADRTISFTKSSSTLSTDGKAVVADVAAALKSSTAKVEIGGHTDWKGRAPLNQALSQARADAVREALVAAGVDASRVTAKGYGEDVPIANNATEPGRAKNRRIELRVVG